VEQLELAETMEALRAELARAAAAGAGAGFQFPVTGAQLEFHVGVTRAGEGRAGVKFWVVELGGAGSYAREEIQTVTVTLGAPFGSRVRSAWVPRSVGSSEASGPDPGAENGMRR
jgi:hypothetical protein